MDQVSRPMQIALVAVVLFAAVYFVALKPKPASSGSSAPAATSQPAAGSTGTTAGTAPGVTGLTNAIKKAHGAVDTSQANAQTLSTKSAQASGDTTPAATTPSTASTPAATTPAASGSTGVRNIHAKRTTKPSTSRAIPRAGPGRAAAAIADHRVLAVLFYNPRASDDRAVHQTFKGLSTHKGKVILVSAPIGRLAAYKAVTAKVSVTGSPTFIVLDRAGHPRSFVGFVDPAELANHIADALAGFNTK